MARGTKRLREHSDAAEVNASRKKSKESDDLARHLHAPLSVSSLGTATAKHAVLSQLYPNVQRLRDYVLSKLPRSSRLRRKKVAAVGRPSAGDNEKLASDVEQALAKLLDSTLVGLPVISDGDIANEDRNRWEQWAGFSQRADESYVTLSDGAAGAIYSQSEVRCLSRNSEKRSKCFSWLTSFRLSILPSGCSSRRPRREIVGRDTCCAMASAGTWVLDISASKPRKKERSLGSYQSLRILMSRC